MTELRAVRSAKLGAPALALAGAALAGGAIGAIMHKPSGPASSPAPLASEPAVVPSSSTPIRARLRTAVTQLDGVRRPMRDRLARAGTAAQRAQAAEAIGAAYREAARTLTPLKLANVPQSAPTIVLMRQLWREYGALSRAATANEAKAFAAAGASITEHERALEAALARWQAAV